MYQKIEKWFKTKEKLNIIKENHKTGESPNNAEVNKKENKVSNTTNELSIGDCKSKMVVDENIINNDDILIMSSENENVVNKSITNNNDVCDNKE